MIPTFWRRLEDPSIKTVLLVGCGGGFDFVHSVVLIPELVKLGKNIVMASYSFGSHDELVGDDAEDMFTTAEVLSTESSQKCDKINHKWKTRPAPDVLLARKVNASCQGPNYYAPEIHVCAFLDKRFPANAPHSIYASNARLFTVPLLQAFYSKLVRLHEVDAIVLFDGGSDSLMRGDEYGLGDPLEDAVSIAAVAQLEDSRVDLRILISIGFGADRYNNVSDAASLRAVSELTAQGGFMGSISLEPASDAFQCYRACVDHIYERQVFRSVLTACIAAAVEGHFGRGDDGAAPPPALAQTGRVLPGEAFLWPLMAVLWAFDARAVARRSLIIPWIRNCATVPAMHQALRAGRAELAGGIRGIEDLPRHAETCPRLFPDYAPQPPADAAARPHPPAAAESPDAAPGGATRPGRGGVAETAQQVSESDRAGHAQRAASMLGPLLGPVSAVRRVLGAAARGGPAESGLAPG